MPKLRTIQLEAKIMEAELLLDGLYTHHNFFHCMNPIHVRRIKKALGAVRSAREILRNDTKSRQWTLITRSYKFNRHNLWHMTGVPDWKCDCKEKLGTKYTKKGIHTRKGTMKPMSNNEKLFKITCGICGGEIDTEPANQKHLKAVGKVCEDCWDNHVTEEELEEGQRPDD